MTEATATQEAPPAAAAEAQATAVAQADPPIEASSPSPPTEAASPASEAANPASEAAGSTAPAPEAAATAEPSVDVRPARLPEAPAQTVPAEGGQMDILLNTTMPVTAGLGQVSIQVRHLLQLGAGSVVKLDRRVGEPIDLFLRGVKFATGQLVVVGEHLGVRIKEILPAGVAEVTVGSS